MVVGLAKYWTAHKFEKMEKDGENVVFFKIDLQSQFLGLTAEKPTAKKPTATPT